MRDKIFLALMDTQAAHWEQARKRFEELKLTDGQPKVLYILRAVEGCVQKELAAVCGIRESTLTVLLKKMEEQGYIEKRKIFVSGGKSAKAIYLTQTGRTLSDQIDQAVEELEVKSFEGFSEAEKEALFTLLHRVEENLK